MTTCNALVKNINRIMETGGDTKDVARAVNAYADGKLNKPKYVGRGNEGRAVMLEGKCEKVKNKLRDTRDASLVHQVDGMFQERIGQVRHPTPTAHFAPPSSHVRLGQPETSVVTGVPVSEAAKPSPYSFTPPPVPQEASTSLPMPAPASAPALAAPVHQVPVSVPAESLAPLPPPPPRVVQYAQQAAPPPVQYQQPQRPVVIQQQAPRYVGSSYRPGFIGGSIGFAPTIGIGGGAFGPSLGQDILLADAAVDRMEGAQMMQAGMMAEAMGNPVAAAMDFQAAQNLDFQAAVDTNIAMDMGFGGGGFGFGGW